jgi:hypothetical protein
LAANLPPAWSDAELEAERVFAKRLFREERMREPLEEYLDQFRDARAIFEELLAATDDLTLLRDRAIDVLVRSRLLTALRYVTGPPVSADDLKVLAETTSLSPKHLRAHPELTARIVDTLLLGLDQRRFSWLAPGEERLPTADERNAAVLASAALLATRRVETLRRNLGKQNQEQKVKDTLRARGFEEVKIGKIEHLSKAPQPGQFCGETQLGSRKADIIVGLWDLRTMAIECKVSNSAVNSIKRLNNDAEAKGKSWRIDFGLQVVPAAVLSGVYDHASLLRAQDAGLALFWGHRLEKLIAWIDTTRM